MIHASGYAAAHRLHAGSVITLARHDFRVVGIVSQPAATVPDLLIPIRVAQALSGFRGEITTVDVAVASAADLAAVTAKVKAQLPWADMVFAHPEFRVLVQDEAEVERLMVQCGVLTTRIAQLHAVV